MNRIFNSLVNKITWILIIAIVGLTCFFIGLNNAHALEASQFGTYIGTITIDSLTSTSSYTYDEYNSDTIKDKIFTWSNEQFFDNTYTQAEFFSHYNYVVMAYNSTTIRVFIQNYDLIMDYQGLTPIESDDIKFYFANMTYNYQEGLYAQYRGGVSVIYSYYIDINYNSDTYSFSDNNPLLDLEFYSLSTGSSYFASSSDRSYLNLNMRLFDSYNNNFAWIQNWATLYNTTELWNQVAGSTPSKTSIYYNSPIEFPTLEYVSSGATPDDSGGGSEGGTDLSGVEDRIDETNSILEQTKEILEGIGESVGQGLNTLIEQIKGIVSDIYDFFTEPFDDYSSIEEFFENFSESDVGGISAIVSLPLDLVRSLTNNDSCESLILPIWDEEVPVPSGCIMWEQADDSVITVWHTVICGLGSYFILVDAFKTKEKLLDPANKEVSTLDL